MWLTILAIIFIIIVALILHDIGRILKLQDELIKEQYLMRGELNAILDMASLGTSFIPSMFETKISGEEEQEKDETTTVEINETKPE
jgi:hypothetical protein